MCIHCRSFIIIFLIGGGGVGFVYIEIYLCGVFMVTFSNNNYCFAYYILPLATLSGGFGLQSVNFKFTISLASSFSLWSSVSFLTIQLFTNRPSDDATWQSKPDTREPVWECANERSPTQSDYIYYKTQVHSFGNDVCARTLWI